MPVEAVVEPLTCGCRVFCCVIEAVIVLAFVLPAMFVAFSSVEDSNATPSQALFDALHVDPRFTLTREEFDSLACSYTHLDWDRHRIFLCERLNEPALRTAAYEWSKIPTEPGRALSIRCKLTPTGHVLVHDSVRAEWFTAQERDCGDLRLALQRVEEAQWIAEWMIKPEPRPVTP